MNDAPEIATIADATIAEDATFELTIPATDVEDQQLTLTGVLLGLPQQYPKVFLRSHRMRIGMVPVR